MSPKITEENGFAAVRNIERETWFLLIIYHLKSTFTNFHWFLTMDRHLNGAKKCFSSTIMIFCGTLQTFVQNHTFMWFRDDIFRITVDVFFFEWRFFFLISSNVAVDLVADRRKKNPMRRKLKSKRMARHCRGCKSVHMGRFFAKLAFMCVRIWIWDRDKHIRCVRSAGSSGAMQMLCKSH